MRVADTTWEQVANAVLLVGVSTLALVLIGCLVIGLLHLWQDISDRWNQ